MRYSIDENGVPYLHTPNLPPYPIGPDGDLHQAQVRIAGHQRRCENGTLDWRVDWPDRLVIRVKVNGKYVWRRVRIDQNTGKRGRPTIHATRKEALA